MSPRPIVLLDARGKRREYILSEDISAMQVLQSYGDSAFLSPVSKLPRGAHIVTCGDGFDPQTLKVTCEGLYYFVFARDLAEEQSFAVAGAN